MVCCGVGSDVEGALVVVCCGICDDQTLLVIPEGCVVVFASIVENGLPEVVIYDVDVVSFVLLYVLWDCAVCCLVLSEAAIGENVCVCCED